MEEVKMKNLFAVASFLLAVSLGAQENVFAPFVSRLTADVKNNLVRLSWVDSPDVKGPVAIYTSDYPINLSELSLPSEKKLVQVDYGVQFYVDEIDYKIRYYFVAASDESGKMYHLAIPFNNVVMVNMQDFLSRQQNVQPLEARVDTNTDTDFSLRAVVQEEGVVVSFNTAGYSNLVLHRSIQPIRKVEDLFNAVIIQVGATSPFIDYLVPGIPYYYAIVPRETLVSGNVNILPGDNATIMPATTPLSQDDAGFRNPVLMRPIPLPLLSLSALIGVNSVPDASPQKLSPDAEQIVMGIKRPEIPIVKKKPRVFKEDMEPPIKGEEYTLRFIMQSAFVKRDWITAREQLTRFLSLPRAVDVEIRTRFYLGQVYYFLNMPRESLFEFFMIKTKYPEEAAEWISAVLEMLISP
jgi:hypothetical protein